MISLFIKGIFVLFVCVEEKYEDFFLIRKKKILLFMLIYEMFCYWFVFLYNLDLGYL